MPINEHEITEFSLCQQLCTCLPTFDLKDMVLYLLCVNPNDLVEDINEDDYVLFEEIADS